MTLLLWNIGVLELSLIFLYDRFHNINWFPILEIWIMAESYPIVLHGSLDESTLNIVQVSDYARDIEEMQSISREDFLASLRR